MWSGLILDWASRERVFELELTSETLALPLFANASINRKLDAGMLKEILDKMAASGKTIHAVHNPSLLTLGRKCRVD